jgi:hypothetical protein
MNPKDGLEPYPGEAHRDAAQIALATPAPPPERWVVFDPVTGSYLAGVVGRHVRGTIDRAEAWQFRCRADADRARVTHWPTRASAFAMRLTPPTLEA